MKATKISFKEYQFVELATIEHNHKYNQATSLNLNYHLYNHTNLEVIVYFLYYLPSIKFIDVVRILQAALSSVSVLSININVDIGVGPGSHHVTSEDTHFVGVDCQTKQGFNY